MAGDVRIDFGGIGSIMRSPAVRAIVSTATEEVAGNVRSQGLTVEAEDGSEVLIPVEVSVITTDRAHGSVLLAHPAGAAVQAKHGALTKAASGAGLSVAGS